LIRERFKLGTLETWKSEITPEKTAWRVCGCSIPTFQDSSRPKPETISPITSTKLTACGGIYIFPGAILASLNWGMVARAYHRTGIGSALLEYRLNWLRETAIVRTVILNTPPAASGFFEQFGFVFETSIENPVGTGIQQLEMRLQLRP
jgi:hypothetical protein